MERILSQWGNTGLGSDDFLLNNEDTCTFLRWPPHDFLLGEGCRYLVYHGNHWPEMKKVVERLWLKFIKGRSARSQGKFAMLKTGSRMLLKKMDIQVFCIYNP